MKAVTLDLDHFAGMYVVFLASGPDEGDPEDWPDGDNSYVAIARVEKSAPNGRSLFEPLLAFRTQNGSLKRSPHNITEYDVGRDEDLYARVDASAYECFVSFAAAYVFALGQLTEHRQRWGTAA
jgi:hypothetical protein